MNTLSNQQLLDVCINAARTAGQHALQHIHRRAEVLETFDHDVKLVMDRECQTLAENVVLSHFPDHAILGEEGIITAHHDYEWIIDPIDGTANYSRGLPSWCCSVAVRHQEQSVAGCIFIPTVDECFTATLDGPALCNNQPIRASVTSTLNKATFFAGLTKEIDPRAIALFCDMAPLVSKIGMIGSAAIDICHVACGRSDGYYEAGLYLWDIAAAGLIAERAGAITSAWPRNDLYGVRYLCTTPALHNDIKQIVETHFR